MHELKLKTVLELERSLKLDQVPIDEARATVVRWRQADRSGELSVEKGAIDVIERVLRLTDR